MMFNKKFCLACLTACVVLAAAISTPSSVDAQEKSNEESARAAMESKLEALMDDLELFYKTNRTETGQKTYVVLFEMDDDSTKMNIEIRSIGTFRDQQVFSLYAWSAVAGDDAAMPPSVIKLVATANDALSVGSYSMSENFKAVYCNATMPMDQATSTGLLYMCVGHLHINRIDLKNEIAAIRSSN